MKWYNQLKLFIHSIKRDRATLEVMREDLNDTIKDTQKLLYRLEEVELQVKLSKALISQLEARKQDRYPPLT